MKSKEDITPVWYCDGKLKIIPLENFKQSCTCYTNAYRESTGGCPIHGIYINDSQ